MDPCFPLKGSQACPLVNDYSITSGDYLTFYSFLPPVQNVSQFDVAIEAYANNLSQYADAGCPSVLPPRFTLTLICADLVSDPISESCSSLDVNKKSPGICAQTCADFRASLYDALGNKTLCPKWDGTQLGGLGQRLDALCNKPDGSGNCISGLENESTTCGFLNKTSRCEFCSQQNTAACCSDCPKPTTSTSTSTTTSPTSSPIIMTTTGPSPSEKSGLGMPAMWGLIFGSVAVVGIAIGIALFYYCIRDRSKHERVPSIEPTPDPTPDNQSSIASSETITRTSAVRLVPSPDDQTISNLPSSNRGSDNRSGDNLLVDDVLDEVPTNDFPTIEVVDVPGGDPAGNVLPGPITFPPDEDNIVIVVHPYTAQLQDELNLTPNDSIILRRIFDDGWAVGYNQNTHQEGAFPIVCVVYSHFLQSEIGTNDTLPEMSGHSESTPLAADLTRDSLSNSGVIRSSSISSNPSLRRQFSLTESLESVPRRNSSMRRARARSGDNDEFAGNRRSSVREWGEL